MPNSDAEEAKIQGQMNDSAQKTADTVKNDVKPPQSEQAVTRDTTPSVERPGHQPTQPDRPKP